MPEIWTDRYTPPPAPKPRGRERTPRLVIRQTVAWASGSRRLLEKMNEKFAKAMRRAGYGQDAYAAGNIHSNCAVY
jgi:hypothetical protein